MRVCRTLIGLAAVAVLAGCMTAEQIRNREMAKKGFRKATRAEMLAPITPTFSIPKLGPAEPARPRSDLVGKWQLITMSNGRLSYLTSGYMGPVTTTQSVWTYQFFEDGTFTLVIKVVKAGTRTGHETNRNGKWSYKDGVLTLFGLEVRGKEEVLVRRVTWHGADTFLVHDDLEQMKKGLGLFWKESGVECAIDCCYASDGAMNISETYLEGNEEKVLCMTQRPLVHKRIGDVGPE